MPFFMVTSVCTSDSGPSMLQSEPIIEGLRAMIQFHHFTAGIGRTAACWSSDPANAATSRY